MASAPLLAPERVVLDTNTVLALWMFRDPALPRLREALEGGRLRAVSRADALEELRRVLAYPQFGVGTARQGELLAFYRQRCEILELGDDAGGASLPRCRDADDQKFLEIALAGDARCLLSRDKALLKLARHALVRSRFRILTPERLEKQLLEGASSC